MSSSLTPVKGELESLDQAVRKLKAIIAEDDDSELAELTRNLALELGKAASTKMRTIRERQDSGEDVDGRAFSPVSTALEKISKAFEATAKRKQARVEEAQSVVHAEVDRIKLERGGTDMSNIGALIFPFQGANRLTASPILKQLNETNVKLDDTIDAEAVEVVDEDPKLVQNEG